MPLQCQLHRGRAEFIGLLHVGCRRDVARCALQVIGHGPVELVAVRLLDHVGHHRRGATQLRMAERIARALLGQELAVGVMATFGNHDGAVAVFLDQLLDSREEFLLVEFNLGEKHHDRDAVIGDQAAGRRNPACVPAHHFEHEDLGRCLGHGPHIERSLERRHRDVLCHRAKAGAAIGDRQVVVHRLGDVDGLYRVAHGFG